MQLELQCAECFYHFHHSAEEVLEQLHAEGPWYALGDGETFEDRIHAQISAQTDTTCPRCGQPVTLTEERLGQLSRELLAQW